MFESMYYVEKCNSQAAELPGCQHNQTYCCSADPNSIRLYLTLSIISARPMQTASCTAIHSNCWIHYMHFSHIIFQSIPLDFPTDLTSLYSSADHLASFRSLLFLTSSLQYIQTLPQPSMGSPLQMEQSIVFPPKARVNMSTRLNPSVQQPHPLAHFSCGA